jgi:hypothetical protein
MEIQWAHLALQSYQTLYHPIMYLYNELLQYLFQLVADHHLFVKQDIVSPMELQPHPVHFYSQQGIFRRLLSSRQLPFVAL